MHSSRCGIVHLLPALDESFQIARVDQDASHDASVACTRARDADCGNMSVEHEVAQRPVAAATAFRGSSEARALDEREASGRISGVMAVRKLRGELRTAAVKIQRMVRATT
jgi:hypothetical protein